MSSKRAPRDKNTAFGRVTPPSATPMSTDAALFGSIAAAEARNIHASATDIFAILPDITQPRRTVPVSLREKWDGTPRTIDRLFASWIGAFADEIGVSLNDIDQRIRQQLIGAEITDMQENSTAGVMEASLMPVVELAASIRSNGLLNPISVAIRGPEYIIEAGERRWLAYHLLHLYFGESGEDWSSIPARIVERWDVWRQAIENSQRSDLNAISKTRQFALLLMDLLRQQGMEFARFDTFQHEREFYAQVANAKTHRVPSGTNTQLENAMGLTRHSLSKYRALLSLPNEAWELADDHHMTFELLYDLSRLTSDEALAKIRELVYPEVTSHKLTPNSKEARNDPPGTSQHLLSLNRLMKQAQRGDQQAQEAAKKKIIELRQWLEFLEEQL